MRNPLRLAVEIDGDKITVSHPEAGEHVAYCKDPIAPMLVATDLLRGELSRARLVFLVEAWKAAGCALNCGVGTAHALDEII